MKYVLTLLCGVALAFGSSGDVQAQANNNEIGNFTRVFDIGISGADNPSNPNGVKNMVRSWELEAGHDIDSDGLKEFSAYDASNKVYFIWENTARGVNDYEVVFTVPEPGPLFGGDRSIMVTDMDHDGNKELVIVWDSFAPGETDGFEALWVYEHVPGSGEFLPATPQLMYDPPRNLRGRIALETQSIAGDFDFDGNTELALTYRAGQDMLIAVLEFTGYDIATGAFNIEFIDRGGPDGGGSTAGDSTAFINRVHGMISGDLNGDGRPELVMVPDTNPVEVRVYTTTGADAWDLFVFDENDLPPVYVTAKGSNATPGIGDFNGDGYNEVYIIGRGKVAENPTNRPRLWVVSPAGGGHFDLPTAFNAANFTDLEVSEIVPPTEQNKDDLRGGLIADGDNDGNLEVYILSRDLTTVFATEWVGDPGFDVTDPFNYQTTALYNSKDDHPDLNIQFSNIQGGDLDGDGPNHFDLVFISPNAAHEGLGPSLFVIEFNETGAPIFVDLGWRLPIAVNDVTSPGSPALAANGNDFDLAIGGDPAATDGLDRGLDVVAAPPGLTYYASLATAPPINQLKKDIRGWVAPFQDEIVWTMPVINATGITTEVSWVPVNLPPEGSFSLEEVGKGINVNMRNQSSVQFDGNATVIFRYLPMVPVTFNFDVVGGAWYLVSLPVIPEDNLLSTLFPDALAAFCWDFATQSYQSATSLQPERAYWLLFTATSTAGFSGQPLNSYTNNYSNPGWDMIGSVLEPSSLVDDPDNSVLAMFGWNAATQSYGTVDPFNVVPKQGYWALVFDVPSSFTIGGAPGSASDVTKAPTPEDLAAFHAKYGSLPPGPPDFKQTDVATEEVIPQTFGLYQNYPNPFNPETRIRFDIPSTADRAVTVRLAIYNVTGQLIRVVLDEERPAGSFEITWDGKNRTGIQVPSGMYFYKITAGEFVDTKKMLLLK